MMERAARAALRSASSTVAFLARFDALPAVSLGFRTRFLAGVRVRLPSVGDEAMASWVSVTGEASSALIAEAGAFFGARFLDAGLAMAVAMAAATPLVVPVASAAVSWSSARSSGVSSVLIAAALALGARFLGAGLAGGVAISSLELVASSAPPAMLALETRFLTAGFMGASSLELAASSAPSSSSASSSPFMVAVGLPFAFGVAFLGLVDAAEVLTAPSPSSFFLMLL